MPSLVQQYAWHLCLIGGGGSICCRYMYIVLYIYRSAIRCAKCGVAVCKASMLDWGISLPWVFVHCAIYETYVVSWFCRDLSSIGGGSICHRYMSIVLYIYRSAMRCAKFGAAVLQASMLDWRWVNLP